MISSFPSSSAPTGAGIINARRPADQQTKQGSEAALADEPEWLATLPAEARQVYEFWKSNLKPGGFKFGPASSTTQAECQVTSACSSPGQRTVWKHDIAAVDASGGHNECGEEDQEAEVDESAAAPDGKLKNKEYEHELAKLHVELVKLQQWVVHKGLKVCVVFEGRDGAGKGGVIKAITERVSPRVFRVVALPAPTEREKSQMYIQRYMPHLPAAGEIVIFDRSWYNRAGVERVMGFCPEEQAKRFLEMVPTAEKAIIESGHHPAEVLAGGQSGRAVAAAGGPHR